MTPGFAQDDGEVTAAEAESLLNGAGYCDFGFVAGNSEFVAVNPDTSGAVVDFKCGHSHHVERIHHPACNRDFVVVKARRITIDRLNAAPCGAGSEHDGRGEMQVMATERKVLGTASSGNGWNIETQCGNESCWICVAAADWFPRDSSGRDDVGSSSAASDIRDDTLIRNYYAERLPRARQHQRDIVGLFGAADPIIDRGGHNFRNAFERQVAVFLDEFDQAFLAEFAKVIFGFGDAVTVGKKNFAGAKLDRIFIIANVVEKTDDGAAILQPLYDAGFREHQRRQMAGIAEGKPAITGVIHGKK